MDKPSEYSHYVRPSDLGDRCDHQLAGKLKALSVLLGIHSGLNLLALLIFGYLGVYLIVSSIPPAQFPDSMQPWFQRAYATTVHVVVIGVILLAFQTWLSFMGAIWVAGRRRYSRIMHALILACLSIPLGTALGIFGIVVITRPGVKGAFSKG